MAERPSRLGLAVVALWLIVHVAALLRGVLPLPGPWSGQVPWKMFLAPSEIDSDILAEGLDASGRWIEIPLHDYFHFTRGATDRRVYDESRILLQPGRSEERAAFARWLAAKMSARGTPVRQVRLLQRRTRVHDGKIRVRSLGHFEVGDGAQ